MAAEEVIRSVYDLVEKELGAKVTEDVNPVTSTVTTAVTQILREDATRVAVIIINLGANDMIIGFDREVSASRGIRVGANGGHYTMYWKEDFTLCARAMWAVTVAGSTDIYVVVLRIYAKAE